MKSLFLLGLVGLFSLGSVLEAEAGCRRRCRGHRRGCGNVCYTQPCYTNGGCQTYGGATHGYVDPNAAAPAPAVQEGAAVDANAVPAEPEPVK